MTAAEITPMSRADIRAGVKAFGWGNSVRPPARSSMLGSQRGMIVQGDLAGAFLTVAWYEGQASDGYKTNYTALTRWWIVLTVSDEKGYVLWHTGTRFANKAKAQAEFEDSAQSIREGR